ncbi:MAG: DUF1127 domain-containing protein [Pseudomonadota bacterium]
MAFTDISRAMGASLLGRPSAIVSETRAAYTRWRLYRQTLSELRSLSNRELTDLGLNRSMLRSVAVDAVYGDRA